MLFGWDGASYQGRPNVAQLKAEGHDFVLEKVTGEGSYVNPFWSQVRDDARAAGVVFGTYDWVEPQTWSGRDDAIAAASEYLGVVGARQTGELLAVDFETPDWAAGPLGRDIEAAMRAYLYALRDEGGQPVIVYTARYFLEETGASGWAWLGRDFILWQAAPGPQAMLPDDAPWPATPDPFTATTLQQHQWHATSTAVVGEFDRNRFRGTIGELQMLGKPDANAPQTAPAPPGAPEAPESVRAYLDARGGTVVELRFGGQATSILGVNAVDVGVSVVNAAGETWDRSVQGGQFQPWRKRA